MSTQLEEIEVGRGMSQDELISRFAELDESVKRLGAERRDIGMQLAGIAYDKRAGQNTVHLTSTGGNKVDVVFGTETEYINDEMFAIRELIGQEQFDELFNVKVEFSARKRALNMFMSTVHPSEALETAKQMIKDATIIKDKTPYCSLKS